MSSKGHIIIVFNLHIPSIYSLSSTDLPLLTSIRDLARWVLSQFFNSDNSVPSPLYLPSMVNPPAADVSRFRIGFITPPFRDNKIPVTDHLHAHAYIVPADSLGWWRGIAYSPIAWYGIDDLIAEIRESTSNNRVRSAVTKPRPIDQIPGAGARSGHANGQETTERGVVPEDAYLEDGLHSAAGFISPMSLSGPSTPTTGLSSAPFLPSSSRIPMQSA